MAEGDVQQLMHRDASPLSPFWETWDGSTVPATVLAPLAAHLEDGPLG